jgi:hypothetical protein
MDIADICSRLEALTEAVRGIGLGLEEMSYRGAAFAAPMAELPPMPSPNPRPRRLPADWPKIGGRVDLAEIGDLFVDSAYRDQYREGDGREEDPSAQPAHGRRIRRAVWADPYRILDHYHRRDCRGRLASVSVRRWLSPTVA